jgi:hypothetical protein
MRPWTSSAELDEGLRGAQIVRIGDTFGMFWFALLASYVSLLAWPRSVVFGYSPQSALQRGTRRLWEALDFDRRFDWTARPGGLRVEVDGRPHRGPSALGHLLLYAPAAWFASATAQGTSRRTSSRPTSASSVTIAVQPSSAESRVSGNLPATSTYRQARG